ncbi:3-hydroxylacyl-ACP dehydratase [Paraglaciecola sp. 2405UD69-4]|uniref:ApeP family dehydratase n=1 Tax=Paraglaciecola sp. 2405UD69-4 TaxID=3391836 RepID=UPI0039C9C7E8
MNKYAIEDVVPHAHPMILIEQLKEFSEDSATCLLEIREQSNFYNPEKKSVPSYVGLEYLAQSIAAYANANKVQEGGEVALGFLVSARNFKAAVSEFTLGMQLETKVTKLFKEENGLSVFDCLIFCDEEQLIEAKINVYEPENPELYLKENT